MLDSLLKSKFYTKCKTNIKVVKTRVEAIKKKKIAVQKFLKNDIADLLRNGLDMNAYGRVEGFMIEQNMTRCYELVESFCVIITSNSHLSLMQKQKECPEECREAVASLMFAAARFADLPELRDLRNVFTERYGNSLHAYANGELMERLSPMEYMKDRKLQVLQDIASEFSIAWDSKTLDQKLFTPPIIQDQAKNTRLNDDDDNASENGTSWARRNRETSFNRRQNADRQWNRETSAKQQFAGAKSSSSEDESVTGFSQDDRKTSSSSGGSLSDEDDAADSLGIWRRPPPYLKPKPEKTREEEDEKARPMSVRRRNDIDGKKPLPPPPGHEDEAIDNLLMHYSSKKSPYEAGEEAKPRRIRGKRPEPGTAPGRAASLPTETKAEAARAPARAASLQPDCQVYPKLPGDYDELAARIAALRRN